MRETKFTHAERRTRHGAEEIFPNPEEGNPRIKERKSKPRGRKSKNFSSANLDFPMGYRRFQIKKILGPSSSLSASVRAPGHAAISPAQRPTIEAKITRISVYRKKMLLEWQERI